MAVDQISFLFAYVMFAKILIKIMHVYIIHIYIYMKVTRLCSLQSNYTLGVLFQLLLG
jgi:hypothetical protein